MMELTGSERLSNVSKDLIFREDFGKYGVNSSDYGESGLYFKFSLYARGIAISMRTGDPVKRNLLELLNIFRELLRRFDDTVVEQMITSLYYPRVMS